MMITRLLAKLNNYFVPKVNIIHERARFHLRARKQGESAEEYIRTLFELAKTCQFGPAKIENIRDKLVVGILEKGMSVKLQLTAESYESQIRVNNILYSQKRICIRRTRFASAKKD